MRKITVARILNGLRYEGRAVQDQNDIKQLALSLRKRNSLFYGIRYCSFDYALKVAERYIDKKEDKDWEKLLEDLISDDLRNSGVVPKIKSIDDCLSIRKQAHEDIKVIVLKYMDKE